MAVGISLTPSDGGEAEVIGVVPDVLFGSPEEGTRPEVFVAFSQMPETDSYVIRTSGEPLAALPLVRQVLSEIDPTLPVFGIRTLESMAVSSTADTRVLMGLLSLFAGLALLLSATGIWGIVAFAVTQRRRELGLRMALGADRDSVMGLMLRKGMLLAGIGVVGGAAGAWFLSRLLESVLYEVGGRDPFAFVGGAAVLTVVALLATWLPARRATTVDPMEALRSE